jgi:hypothetical protein
MGTMLNLLTTCGRTENIIHNIDVVLISGIQFTEDSYLKLRKYTTHPAGTARGGTVIIIIISSIKDHQLNNYSQNFLQATSVSVS